MQDYKIKNKPLSYSSHQIEIGDSRDVHTGALVKNTFANSNFKSYSAIGNPNNDYFSK